MVKQNLDCIFNPSSIVIAGVSTKGKLLQLGGNIILQALLSCGFKGEIYPLNPKGGEVSGLKVYTSIKDVPGTVDYAICCISAPQVPQFIQDCIAKGVKAVHVYTGGFSESGTDEGKQLEENIFSLSHRSGIRILGPNCLGVYNPKAGLSFSPGLPSEGGTTSIICQSGGISFFLTREIINRGAMFNKLISYGNACDINESDLLEYLATDVDTKVIGIYIEGVKEGGRFSRLLKETANAKPIIVLKAGLSEAGARAAASHTGVLAGSGKIWDVLLHQAGAIKVDSLEELVDTIITFQFLPSSIGRKVGVIGGGGGSSVLTTDYCTNAGLVMPRLSRKIQDKLRSYFVNGVAGATFNNPVDLSERGWNIYYDCIKAMLDYRGIDLLIYQFPMGMHPALFPYPEMEFMSNLIADNIIKAYRKSSKPMAVVIHSSVTVEDYQAALNCKQRCSEAGLPVYHSVINAAKAIARFTNYHERRGTIADKAGFPC